LDVVDGGFGDGELPAVDCIDEAGENKCTFFFLEKVHFIAAYDETDKAEISTLKSSLIQSGGFENHTPLTLCFTANLARAWATRLASLRVWFISHQGTARKVARMSTVICPLLLSSGGRWCKI
jgi:hypothetical protein